MTDTTLDALAACLDEIEALAARLERLSLFGLAAKLRATQPTEEAA